MHTELRLGHEDDTAASVPVPSPSRIVTFNTPESAHAASSGPYAEVGTIGRTQAPGHRALDLAQDSRVSFYIMTRRR